MLLTTLLLFAAVGLVVAAVATGHTALAWGSVALSAVTGALILVRWRRSWRQRQDEPEVEPVGLLDDESADGQSVDGQPADAQPGEHRPQPAAVAAVDQAAEDTDLVDSEDNAADADAEPGEEDTDAADLLVVYELADEVVVVDEHPRYHLTRCRWPDQAHTERLPVKEARELGFTPCGRCRPDTALARRHRAASATAAGG